MRRPAAKGIVNFAKDYRREPMTLRTPQSSIPIPPVGREMELTVLGKERTVVIQLCGVLLHHLLCILHSVLTVEFGAFGVGLLIRMIIYEEIFDFSEARRFLVDRKARGELFVCSYLNSVKH